MNLKRTVMSCALILLAGTAVTALIFSTEPTAQREGATRQTAMLVDVVPVERGTYRPTIVATGNVAAAEEIVLRPRVTGEVVSRSPNFSPGARVSKGELLVQIDAADYHNAVAARRSELREAQAARELEHGRQQVARQDYRFVDSEVKKQNRALMLREPQMQAAEARVAAARAALAQAELELQRTRIEAPFDAHVLSREANIGEQVGAGDPLGRLVALENYWVTVTVPVVKLKHIAFPAGAGADGASVEIRDRSAWPPGVTRRGRVLSLIGALEAETRLARLLVNVTDPLGLDSDSAEVPALIIGAYVEARITGEAIPNVVRLERDYLRDGDTVWVMAEDDALQIRTVEVFFKDAEYAYIARGLTDGDRVVTSNLATVTDGAPLRLASSSGAQTEGAVRPDQKARGTPQ